MEKKSYKFKGNLNAWHGEERIFCISISKIAYVAKLDSEHDEMPEQFTEVGCIIVLDTGLKFHVLQHPDNVAYEIWGEVEENETCGRRAKVSP